MADYKIPLHLKHKPLYAVDGYRVMDGYYKHDTDVVGLSVGKAQWSKEAFVPAVKVWRRTEKRWSRQSEETTVTRALDMAALVIKVLDKQYHGSDLEPFASDDGMLPIREVQSDPAMMQAFERFLDGNREDIDEHIRMLYEALSTYMANVSLREPALSAE